MKIIETSLYKRSYKKLLNKHMKKELEILDIIYSQMYLSNTLEEFLNSKIIPKYHIEQKNANLKGIYTARLNGQTRLLMRPIGKYPYKLVEIVAIELLDINEKHYKN